MTELSDLASFHQGTHGISDVSIIDQKPLAPNMKDAGEESNDRESSIDNRDGLYRTDYCEKPIAPSFGSVMERGQYERNNSATNQRIDYENDEEKSAKNNFDVYPHRSPDNNHESIERGDKKKNEGNYEENLGEYNIRDDRSKYYSEKRHFHGFVSNSEFSNPWRKPENINVYATKKTIAQGMLDVALLAANATQLKNLLVVGEAYQFYIFTLTLVCLSIALQVLVGILFIILGNLDINRRRDQRAAIIMNDIILIAIFLISLINIIIAGFNIDFSYKPPEFSEAGKNAE